MHFLKKKILAIALLPALMALLLFFTATGCEVDTNVNNRVVMIGDSIFALSGEIANELENLSGESYRSYYVSGAELEGGFVTSIPEQYQEACLEDADIRTIILDGGGNDIQVGARTACTGATVSGSCRAKLDDALAAAEQLFREMRDDGVENIVYLNYFYIKNTDIRPAFLYMHDEMEKLIQKYDGIIVDPMPIFNEHPEYIGSDNIHPTDEGSQVLANLIWDAMAANDIEQNAAAPGSGGNDSGSNSEDDNGTDLSPGGCD